MGTQRWWKRLDRWVRSQGLSREDVVRRSGHELGHVLPYFESRAPGGRLRLFLDLVEAAGGKLSALAGNDVAAAVEHIDLARQEIEMSKSWLAEAAGLYRPHLNRTLGARQNMALATFDQLVTALDLWDDLEIVPRSESVEVAPPVAVGGERWTTATGRGSSTRSTTGPRRLAVVGATADNSPRAQEGEVTGEQLREMKERLQRAEQEKDAALARAKRAENALAKSQRRVEELEARVEVEQERRDEAEEMAAEAAQRAMDEAGRADKATARAASAEQLARREVRRANQEYTKAEDEKRRAAGLEIQLRAERAHAANERNRAEEAERQRGQLAERLQHVEAELMARPGGSSWLSKAGYVGLGVVADRTLPHLIDKIAAHVAATKAAKSST